LQGKIVQQLERECRKTPSCASIMPEQKKEDLVPYRIACIKQCMVNEAKAQHCFDELYRGNPVLPPSSPPAKMWCA
jgi:hypothetical protein